MATTINRFDEPNEMTKAAIKEAKSGKNPNKVYDSVDELIENLDSDEWNTKERFLPLFFLYVQNYHSYRYMW